MIWILFIFGWVLGYTISRNDRDGYLFTKNERLWKAIGIAVGCMVIGALVGCITDAIIANCVQRETINMDIQQYEPSKIFVGTENTIFFFVKNPNGEIKKEYLSGTKIVEESRENIIIEKTTYRIKNPILRFLSGYAILRSYTARIPNGSLTSNKSN